MLDLFSGTGSVGQVFLERGFEVVSVDADPQYQPDICVDVLEWDYRKAYPPGHFETDFCLASTKVSSHIIFAAPPCTEYSTLNVDACAHTHADPALLTSRPRRLAQADRIVRRALEIIKYFAPKTWMMESRPLLFWRHLTENPRCGMLARRPFMIGRPYINVDYCMFSDWGYRKSTRIWGSPDVTDRPDVVCHWRCNNLIDGKHRTTIGGGRVPLHLLYRIPKQLVEYLCGWCPSPLST